MKKYIVVLLMLIVSLTVFGCASVNQPISATSNPVGPKVGDARGFILFDWFGAGVGIGRADVGIQKAAKNGDITKISTVDLSKSVWFNGIVVSYHTVVTGE